MSHKADRSFFYEKREWSRRKDRILGTYLAAYLPKVATVGKPILIVDAFAGPGKFAKGDEPGSPLIIAHCIRETLVKRLRRRVEMRLLAIEADPFLQQDLARVLAGFPFAEIRAGTFLDHLNEVRSLANTHSVFIYADPYTVEGLEWKPMDDMFRLVGAQHSVEILLNFNAPSFARRGLGALSLPVPKISESDEDSVPIDAELEEPPTISRLSAIVGRDWWQQILTSDTEFRQKVHRIAEYYCDSLRRRFSVVCSHAVLAKPTHTVPKYYIIFASRHDDALLLMNDEMVKSRDTLAAR